MPSQRQTEQHQKMQLPYRWNDVYESVPRGAPMCQQIIKQLWNRSIENAVFIGEFLDDIYFYCLWTNTADPMLQRNPIFA